MSWIGCHSDLCVVLCTLTHALSHSLTCAHACMHSHALAHMRSHTHSFTGLLDPRWIEKQKEQIGGKRSEHGVYAEGVQIGSSLKQLAERRTDIFGVEETVIGRKIGEEREPQPNPTMQWDGHATRFAYTASHSPPPPPFPLFRL